MGGRHEEGGAAGGRQGRIPFCRCAGIRNQAVGVVPPARGTPHPHASPSLPVSHTTTNTLGSTASPHWCLRVLSSSCVTVFYSYLLNTLSSLHLLVFLSSYFLISLSSYHLLIFLSSSYLLIIFFLFFLPSSLPLVFVVVFLPCRCPDSVLCMRTRMHFLIHSFLQSRKREPKGKFQEGSFTILFHSLPHPEL